MFGKRYQSFDEGSKEPLPAFRRLSKAAQPVPGTIVVGCVVCGARFQKRLDCEFFQCDSCGALVTHAGGSPGGYSAAPAPPMNTISVVVQQPEPKKKKKKKKKKSSNSSSSDSYSSDSSAESAKRKRRDKRRLRALEQQVQSLQSRGSGDQWGNALGQYALPGSDVYARSDIYASRTPWPASSPVSPSARRSPPQLMDSRSGPGQPSSASGSPVGADGWPSAGSQSSPWPPAPLEELYHDSPHHRRSAEKNTRNPFTGDGSSWPNSNDWPSSPSQPWPPSPASKPWPPQSDIAVTVSANPFGDPFGQRPPVTVNVPREIATMSSDQLLLLAQAKRCVEQAQQQQGGQEPLQLQFTKNCRKDSS